MGTPAAHITLSWGTRAPQDVPGHHQTLIWGFSAEDHPNPSLEKEGDLKLC